MAKKGLLLGLLALAFVFVLAGCASSATGTKTSELVFQRKDGLRSNIRVYVDGVNEGLLLHSREIGYSEDEKIVVVVPNGRHTVWIVSETSGSRSETIKVKAASSRIVFETSPEKTTSDVNSAGGLSVSNRGSGLGIEFAKVSETALDN
jgi:hypothetical protein